MLELQDGTRENDKQSLTHMDLHKTKQQVGQCIIEALLVLGRAISEFRLTRLTRLTTARTWGKSAPSALQYTMCLAMGLAPKSQFVPRLSSGSPKIPMVGTLVILGAHNFVCRILIRMRFKAKLQPSLKAFQRYVARHLHARKSGRFHRAELFNPLGFNPYNHSLKIRESIGSPTPKVEAPLGV